MAFIGVGLDIVELPRFRGLYGPDDNEVLQRVFTPLELIESRASVDPIARLAGRFAAKEAALKVLGGLQQGTSLTDLEIRSTTRQPALFLSGEAAFRATSMSIKSWHISITHTEGVAAAVALAFS